MRLKDKVAVITGTGSGIGKTIAELFAAEGAAVVCASRRAENGEPAVAEILNQGNAAKFVLCDVRREKDVERLFTIVENEFGRVDVLVNNAGVNFAKPFEETESHEWDHVINTDLRGAFLCTRLAVKSMLKSGCGSIINITSVHTVASLPGAAPYDAAKWGRVVFTKALAVESAPRRIRVNALSPGLINTQIWTDIQNAAPDPEQCNAYWEANIPAGRVGTSQEIAQAALFLASDESSYITGANLLADGGMTSQLVSRASYESKPLEGA